MAQFQDPDNIALLLQTYTHGQVRFIEEYGLQVTSGRISTGDQIGALVLYDGSLIEPSEYQYFRIAEDGASLQLWEYPEEMTLLPGKARKRHNPNFKFVAEWPLNLVHWVLSPDALHRYVETAPKMPEWNDDIDG